MDPCDPKANITLARAAVIEKLLIPAKMVTNMRHTELCELLRTCQNKQLPDPPLMTKPKKIGKYMISVYLKSPLTAKETATLLGTPTVPQLKKIADKLGLFSNGDNLKERVLSKLADDGIPEPIRFLAKGAKTVAMSPNINSMNRENLNSANEGNNRNNSGNRENRNRNRNRNQANEVNNLNSANEGNRNIRNIVNNGNREFNMNMGRHRITVNNRNFMPPQQQVEIGDRRNKRIYAGPMNFATREGPRYNIASRANRNRAAGNYEYQRRLMMAQANIEKQKQNLALQMRKAQQNKELASKKNEFNKKLKQLANAEKELVNKLKTSASAPAPVPVSNMNQIRKNLIETQKLIASLKQRPQNNATRAQIATTQVKANVMAGQIAATHVEVVPKVVNAAIQASNNKAAVSNIIKVNLEPMAVTEDQKAFVNDVKKLIQENKTEEAVTKIQNEAPKRFNTEKAQKLLATLWGATKRTGRAIRGAVAGTGRVLGGAVTGTGRALGKLYTSATRKPTVEEKRAILNKLLANSSISNENKVKIKTIRNLTSFPKLKTVDNVRAYYNKIVKNKNYKNIANMAEQYGGIRGSLANLRKIAVNKKNTRLMELINRFPAKNISNTNETNQYNRLQEVRAELQGRGNKNMNIDEIIKSITNHQISNAKKEEIRNLLPPSGPIKADVADQAVATVSAGPVQGPLSELNSLTEELRLSKKEKSDIQNLITSGNLNRNKAMKMLSNYKNVLKQIGNRQLFNNTTIQSILEDPSKSFYQKTKNIKVILGANEASAQVQGNSVNSIKKSIDRLMNAKININTMVMGNKSTYRKLALSLHPNKGGGNPLLFTDLGKLKNSGMTKEIQNYYKSKKLGQGEPQTPVSPKEVGSELTKKLNELNDIQARNNFKKIISNEQIKIVLSNNTNTIKNQKYLNLYKRVLNEIEKYPVSKVKVLFEKAEKNLEIAKSEAMKRLSEKKHSLNYSKLLKNLEDQKKYADNLTNLSQRYKEYLQIIAGYTPIPCFINHPNGSGCPKVPNEPSDKVKNNFYRNLGNNVKTLQEMVIGAGDEWKVPIINKRITNVFRKQQKKQEDENIAGKVKELENTFMNNLNKKVISPEEYNRIKKLYNSGNKKGAKNAIVMMGEIVFLKGVNTSGLTGRQKWKLGEAMKRPFLGRKLLKEMNTSVLNRNLNEEEKKLKSAAFQRLVSGFSSDIIKQALQSKFNKPNGPNINLNKFTNNGPNSSGSLIYKKRLQTQLEDLLESKDNFGNQIKFVENLKNKLNTAIKNQENEAQRLAEEQKKAQEEEERKRANNAKRLNEEKKKAENEAVRQKLVEEAEKQKKANYKKLIKNTITRLHLFSNRNESQKKYVNAAKELMITRISDLYENLSKENIISKAQELQQKYTWAKTNSGKAPKIVFMNEKFKGAIGKTRTEVERTRITPPADEIEENIQKPKPKKAGKPPPK